MKTKVQISFAVAMQIVRFTDEAAHFSGALLGTVNDPVACACPYSSYIGIVSEGYRSAYNAL